MVHKLIHLLRQIFAVILVLATYASIQQLETSLTVLHLNDYLDINFLLNFTMFGLPCGNQYRWHIHGNIDDRRSSCTF
jgi:hypothetical protein